MNYLAHGYRFLDDPLLVAGTAVPDWLAVVDRRVRVRSRRLRAAGPEIEPENQSVIRGMLQHLSDDDLFHRSPVFLMLESEIGRAFRRLIPDPYDHRPPFLGHIVTELMLDAWIAERDPQILPRYYDVLGAVDERRVEQVVNRVATNTTDQLAFFIGKFREIRFLYDYLDDHRMLVRLNQVLRRVKLTELDRECTSVLSEARLLLRQHGQDLLNAVESSRDL